MKLNVYLASLTVVLFMGMAFVSRAEAGGRSQKAEDKPLIVYTNQAGSGDEYEDVIAAVKDAGFNVQFVSIAGGGDLTTRAIAEKNNPVADIIWGPAPNYFEQFVNEDMLLKFEPSWASALDKNYLDSKGLYYPLAFSANSYMYNAAVLSPMPQDIIEFANNPVYKDKYVLGRLGSSTFQMILAGILVRYRDPKGQLGISAEGWDLIKRFFENGHPFVQGEDVNGNLISGLYPATPTYGAGFIQLAAQNRDAKLEFMVSPSGVAYTIESIGILKLSKQQEKAKAFVDFFGSAKMQAIFAAKGRFTLHPEAIKAASPEVQSLMNKIRPMDLDWAFITQNLESWIEKITLEYVQ